MPEGDTTSDDQTPGERESAPSMSVCRRCAGEGMVCANCGQDRPHCRCTGELELNPCPLCRGRGTEIPGSDAPPEDEFDVFNQNVIPRNNNRWLFFTLAPMLLVLARLIFSHAA